MTANRMRHAFALFALLIILCSLSLAPAAAVDEPQPALQAYRDRLPLLRKQIDAIAVSAQQAAEAKLAHPAALLNFPGRDQEPFNLEVLSRAGGLALINAYDRLPADYTANGDVVVLSVRSWEKQVGRLPQRIKEFKAKGWLVVVFGSAAGCPENLGADAFIDNGAPTGKAEHGRINIIANSTLSWMWCCEYAAAMSRHGKFPVILYSVAMPGAIEYNAKYRSAEGRNILLPCEKAIPAGELAQRYLQRVEQLVADLSAEGVQQQVQTAADLISRRMQAGKTVGLSGIGHLFADEMRAEMKSPFKAFLSRNASYTEYVKPGDLLVWLAYAGMNSAYNTYNQRIAETGADLITSYAPALDPQEKAPKALAHIDQCWKLPDAEVPIPVFPGVMAPVSGINSALLLRMLDDEVAKRLAAKPQ